MGCLPVIAIRRRDLNGRRALSAVTAIGYTSFHAAKREGRQRLLVSLRR